MIRQALAVLIFAPALWSQNLTPKRVIENVEKRFTEAKTVFIEFTESYLWKLTGEEQELSGTLLLEGEDKFLIETEDQKIVSDGTTLWTYSIPSHRVLIDKLAASKDALLPRQILFQYTENYEARILGGETVLDKPCTVVLFTNSSGEVFIPQVKVWVDTAEWLPVKIEQTDINENLTVYLLEKVRTGVPVEKGTFRFRIPEGADVIDMGEG